MISSAFLHVSIAMSITSNALAIYKIVTLVEFETSKQGKSDVSLASASATHASVAANRSISSPPISYLISLYNLYSLLMDP